MRPPCPDSASRSCSAALPSSRLLAGCGDDDESEDSGSEPTVSLADCTPDQLETEQPGTLTVATDSPAFPPYFVDDDPTNGKGFESAVAYAIAEQLGFAEADVKWVVEPFNSSYAPGPKDFDFDVNQISITPKRAEQVDFSSPYYVAEQAIVTLKDSEFADATSLADFADADDRGADRDHEPGGGRGLDRAQHLAEGLRHLQRRRHRAQERAGRRGRRRRADRLLPDRGAGPGGTTVGQFPAPGGDEWGALLEKGSPLTDCVSAAIDELNSSGELPAIEKRWMSDVTNAPVLE